MFCMIGCERPDNAAKHRDIVVSIKPLYGLVAKVIKGTPYTLTLLFDGTTSPHTTGLTLKETAHLKECDIFFWIGPCYETALSRHAQNISHAIDLSKNAHLTLRPMRTFETECDHHGCDHHHAMDGHYWMDIANAIEMVKDIAQKLSIIFPSDKEIFEENAKNACAALKKFEENLVKTMTSPIISYVTSHDFAQYAERLLRIKCVGVFSHDHHGATLKQTLSLRNAEYLITEPHARIQSSMHDHNHIIILDYLGEVIPISEESYEDIIHLMISQLSKHRIP